jgi:allantoin racemase
MRICCQLPILLPKEMFGPYYELLMKDYLLFKDDTTEVSIHDVPTGLTDPELTNYYGFRMLNDTENVRAMVKAHAENFDAVAGACYFDSGIKAASNILPIPVIGAAESAMAIASMIGHKFAVITSEAAWVAEMESHMEHLGYRDHAIGYRPVRQLTISMAELFNGMFSGQPGPTIENFRAIAEGCIEEGADTIIMGCGLVSPLLTVNGVREVSGAPVIDPMITSLKTAEMMVKLSRAGMTIKTRKGLYQQPAESTREKGLRDLKW